MKYVRFKEIEYPLDGILPINSRRDVETSVAILHTPCVSRYILELHRNSAYLIRTS